MLIDTHAHLTDEVYGGAKEIIRDMDKDNLSRIIAVSYNEQTSIQSKEIATNNENVFFAVGVHPSEVKGGEDFNRLLELSRDKKAVAIGEIGLDYHYDNTDKQLQKAGLLAQLDLVKAANLPVIFHVRDADGDMLEIVKANLDKMPERGVLHCFSGSRETAEQYVKMGFYISFSGAITFKNSVHAAQVISAVPKNRILVETDCPYLAPVPYRGKTNYPKFVSLTATKVAEVLDVDVSEVERFTTQNAFNLFKKMY